MVHDRLSLKLSLLEKANNDIRTYNKLYALVEEEAKNLPAVMNTEEYIKAVIDGAGKIVKEMMADIGSKHADLDNVTESSEGAMVMGLASATYGVIGKESEVVE